MKKVKKNIKKPSQTMASFTVYKMVKMNKRELARFRKWAMDVATEMQTANPKHYSETRYRAALCK